MNTFIMRYGPSHHSFLFGLLGNLSPICSPLASRSSYLPLAIHQCSASTSSYVPLDWTEHSAQQFSIQPSYTSPLHPVWKQQVDKDLRRRLASKLLVAHSSLARTTEGYDAVQQTATANHRVSEMQRSAEDLRSLSERSNLSKCSDARFALGFYSLLEQETFRAGSDAEAFHADVYGQGNVWQHWKRHFAEPYALSPGLEPLSVVYAKPDFTQTSAHPTAHGADQHGQQLGTTETRQHTLRMKGKPRLNALGSSHAIGYRKSSVADVSLSHGQGRIFINDQPHDQVLRDLSVRVHLLQPFLATGTVGQFDVVARVRGGGPSSMAHALQHGIAKALTLLVAERKVSMLDAMVQWDPRKVERKKPGRKKARKGFAFVRR